MTMITDEAVEAAARGMMLAADRDAAALVWDNEPEIMREAFRKQARAALTAALPLMGVERTWAERERLRKLAERIESSDLPQQLDGMWKLSLNMTERDVLAGLLRAALVAEKRDEP